MSDKEIKVTYDGWEATTYNASTEETAKRAALNLAKTILHSTRDTRYSAHDACWHLIQEAVGGIYKVGDKKFRVTPKEILTFQLDIEEVEQ